MNSMLSKEFYPALYFLIIFHPATTSSNSTICLLPYIIQMDYKHHYTHHLPFSIHISLLRSYVCTPTIQSIYR